MNTFLDMDCEDPRYAHHRGQKYLCDWLKAHYIDPDGCFRFEILADGDGRIRAHMWHTQGPQYMPTTIITSLCKPIPVELLQERDRLWPWS